MSNCGYSSQQAVRWHAAFILTTLEPVEYIMDEIFGVEKANPA